MRWVVVDEADLLMTGGYQRDMRKILGSMREGDRAAREQAICSELGIGSGTFQGLPRHLQQQALQGAPSPPSPPRGPLPFSSPFTLPHSNHQY